MITKLKWAPQVTSDFAILDVKGGRKELSRAILTNPHVRYRLVIEADVEDTWSNDDGISQEFGLKVTAMRWEATE